MTQEIFLEKGKMYRIDARDVGSFELPPAADCQGEMAFIKKIDDSANLLTIRAAGDEKIDGNTTFVLRRQYECLTVTSNGLGWDIV